jgi:hypothetical protein
MIFLFCSGEQNQLGRQLGEYSPEFNAELNPQERHHELFL